MWINSIWIYAFRSTTQKDLAAIANFSPTYNQLKLIESSDKFKLI